MRRTGGDVRGRVLWACDVAQTDSTSPYDGLAQLANYISLIVAVQYALQSITLAFILTQCRANV